jgi:phospholipid transport system substrate-binding protein
MKTTQKVYALLWVLAFLLGCNVWAAQSPEKVIEQTSQRMIDALGENEMAIKDDPTIVYDLIETIALPHFDVDYIVRLILGKHWRRATPDQRHRFKQAFQILVMNSYVSALREYSGEKVQILPPAGDQSEVRTLLVRSLLLTESEPIEINYRMRKKNNEWKVIDFTVEGVSLILNYKHCFAEHIQAKGLAVLIDSIERKNAEFKL